MTSAPYKMECFDPYICAVLNLKPYLNGLLDVIYPRICPSCDRVLSGFEEYCCMPCLLDIEKTDFWKYPLENELYMRFAGRVKLKGAVGLFYFDKHGKLQSMIAALKYNSIPGMGEYLGKMLGNEIRKNPELDFDMILPVPLHSRKKLKRGYNQSYHIALGLSQALKVPCSDKFLSREKATSTQTRKNKEQRWMNVRRVFRVEDEFPGKVLIIDDVITTGSTLTALVKQIHEKHPHTEVFLAGIGIARAH